MPAAYLTPVKVLKLSPKTRTVNVESSAHRAKRQLEQTNFCHAVATEFKSRWVENYDGEAFEICKHLLSLPKSEGGITTAMSINDAVREVDAFMSGPVF